jgi:hypothetical protein
MYGEVPTEFNGDSEVIYCTSENEWSLVHIWMSVDWDRLSESGEIKF